MSAVVRAAGTAPAHDSRKYAAARNAHKAYDVEMSKAAHAAKSLLPHDEGHKQFGEFLKSVVYGGMDGIITTFAVVSGATGGELGIDVVLILGFSNMVADALSMGMGDALSSKAENDFVRAERAREEWEFRVNPEGEIAEMVELYTERGMNMDDASAAVKLMAKYKDFFVDVMMVEELGLQVPDEDDSPWRDGLVTFLSFIFFGVFPLLGYVIFPAANVTDSNVLFGIACALTGVMLFILGAVKSKFTTQHWIRSGLEIFFTGGFTAAVSYGLGWLVHDIVGTPAV